MKKIIFLTLVLLLLTSCISERETGSIELHIAAASSLTNPLQELKEEYERDNAKVEIIQSFASSGTLVQQIGQGATVDLFLSADEHWMNEAIQDQLVDETTVQTVVTNQLVLATINEQEILLDDLTNFEFERFSMGDPASVPAGKYAKESLEFYGLWERVKEKAVYGKNVRQALLYVESENVVAGIVYLSDALSSSKDLNFTIIDDESHTPIVYPVGIAKEAPNENEAEKFLSFLTSDKAITIWEKYGFKVSKE
ncbi:molybdate ABC transporter substrate-binding protein [Bacillaceae bacterium S4-13-58]